MGKQLFFQIPKVDKNLSDGDAKYLAKEVLDGIYTPACDIYGLGITLLELAGNFDLPGDGPLWLQLRNNILPKAFYQSKYLWIEVQPSYVSTILSIGCP